MDSKKLGIGDFGDNVARLHEKLRAGSFEVSSEEVKRRFYGPATRDAVRVCQTCHGLEVTGEVDEATATALLTPVGGSPVDRIAAISRSSSESLAPPLLFAGRKTTRLITPPHP